VNPHTGSESSPLALLAVVDQSDTVQTIETPPPIDAPETAHLTDWLPDQLHDDVTNLVTAARQQTTPQESPIDWPTSDAHHHLHLVAISVATDEVLLEGIHSHDSATKGTYRARATAIEASMDGIAILAEDGTYDYLNHAHAEVYGYNSRDHFYNNTWKTCYSDAELDRLETEVMPTLYAEGEWRGEAVGTRQDGTTFPQELSLSLSPNGRIVCIVRDITDQKQREAQLQQHTQRLEEYSRLLAHDLRNPLAVAKARVDVLDATEELDNDHLDSLSDSLDRMEELIADALDYAQNTGSLTEEDMTTVSLGEVVATSWDNVATDDATVTVESTTPITALQTRLEQVFENLFRNAIDHAGEDVTIWCGALPEDAGFYIEDNGPGIPADDRDDVFSIGYSSATDGTGYGLATVSRIVTDHGWDISITDGRTGGARFEIHTNDS
jgi:PAS domain S-box-containing protein